MVAPVKIGLAKPDASIVAAVKQLLRDAESGAVRSLVFIATCASGDCHHYVYNSDKMGLLAELDRLKHRVNIEIDNGVMPVEYTPAGGE